MYQTELGVFHLAGATLSPQLRHDLIYHAYDTRTDRMPKRLKTAAGIDRDVTIQSRAALFNQLRSLTFLGKAQVFIVGNLSPGEAIVHFGDVDFFERIFDARHCVSLR